MGWDVVCGCGGAESCVVCSWLARLDGTSVGRILNVVENLNNNNVWLPHHSQ